MRKEAELWIKQALKDLEMAEKNFEIGGYYITAFLCHRSVEKGLKALYIVKFKRMPEKMHSLIALGGEVEIPEEYFHILREMTPDFIISRYPGIIGEVPYEVYDKETAKEKAGKCKEGDKLDFRGYEKIREFINKLKEKFKPYKIILFGSRARGEYLEESDYNLIIVSDYFKGMPFLKRMKEIYELYDLDVNVDIIPLTKEEYERRKDEISIVGKGIREGIAII